MTAGHSPLPTGTVTFLLTDIQGSTEAWQAAPLEMSSHIRLHYEVLDSAVADHGGRRPEEQGEGDSVVAVFDDPAAAAAAALEAQQRLQSQLPDLPVRMALHTGEAMLRDENNYVGLTIIRCARIRNCGHGGQILVSDETCREIADMTPPGAAMIDLGAYSLRGLSGRSRIWQLTHPDLRATFPPLNAGASASIAWTYESLDPTEQTLMRRLSIFRGSFELDAATLVGSGDGISDSTAMQSTRKLIDQHLLETVDGSDRVAMSTAMRDFCRERLVESADRSGAEERHALWFARIAQGFDGDRPDATIADLTDDLADIIAAVDRATRVAPPDVAYRIIIGLGRHWGEVQNPDLVQDLASWLTRRTPSDGEGYWSAAVARVSHALREVAHEIHDYRDEAQAIAELVGDKTTQRYFDPVWVSEIETVKSVETVETAETGVVDMAKAT